MFPVRGFKNVVKDSLVILLPANMQVAKLTSELAILRKTYIPLPFSVKKLECRSMPVIPRVFVFWPPIAGIISVILCIIYFLTRGTWHEKNPGRKLLTIFIIMIILSLIAYFIVLP